MEASLRAREEAEERAEAIRDLRGWIDRQQKGKGARKAVQEASADGQDGQPGPSSSTAKPRQATITQRAQESGDFHARWDGFDADAALEEADVEPPPRLKRPHAAPSQVQRDWAPADCVQPRTQQNGLPQPQQPLAGEQPAAASREASAVAEAARAAGNDAFKRGDMQSAEEAYTRSIGVQPSAAAFANRAAVRLRRKNWAAAEADASSAIQLDACFLKGWHRRGTARREQGLWLPAAQDFEEALRLEPSSKALQANRAACLASWRQRQGRGKAPAIARIPISSAAAEPPSQEAAQPSRLPLQPNQNANRLRQGGSGAVAAAVIGSGEAAAGEGEPASSCRSSNTAAAANGNLSHADVAAEAGVAGAEQQSAASTALKPALQPAAVQRQAAAIREAGKAEQQPVASQLQASGQPAPLAGETVEQLRALGVGCTAWDAAAPAEAAPVGSSVSKGRPPVARKPPRTGVEFETAWRSLKGDPEGQAAYLRLLDPAALPQLFKQALTAPLLASVTTAALRTLGGQEDAGNSLALLQALPGVPRFGMAAMSLSKQQRAELAALWAQAELALGGGALGELRSAYGI